MRYYHRGCRKKCGLVALRAALFAQALISTNLHQDIADSAVLINPCISSQRSENLCHVQNDSHFLKTVIFCAKLSKTQKAVENQLIFFL